MLIPILKAAGVDEGDNSTATMEKMLAGNIEFLISRREKKL